MYIVIDRGWDKIVGLCIDPEDFAENVLRPEKYEIKSVSLERAQEICRLNTLE